MIEILTPKIEIFVFGSNLAGRHGKGAALHARLYYGAEYGVGVGRTGNAYGIPTKGYKFEILPLITINKSVDDFLHYAEVGIDWMFKLTRIGCGLAKYTDKQIAPMFKGVTSNVIVPVEWVEFL